MWRFPFATTENFLEMQRSRLCVHSFIRSRCVQRIRGRSIYSGAATDTRSSLMLRPGRELEFISNCGREIRFARGGIARIYVIIGGRSETGRIRAFISARARDTRRHSAGRYAGQPRRIAPGCPGYIDGWLLHKLDSRFDGKRNI